MNRRNRTVGDELDVRGMQICDLWEDYISGELVVNRRYQRKLVWTLQEKRDLIDTLLRKYPMPLVLLASYKNCDDNTKCLEIIDGLQRMEAIFAFISGKFKINFEGLYGYFNLDAFPGYGSKIRSGDMHQNKPMLPLDLCMEFIKYRIPCSITETDDDNIDEIFRRVNSKGRKLSNQELRQAGVTGNFANLVRKTASYIREDYTDFDIVPVHSIANYSLNNDKLNYGIDVNSVFWIQHDIINETQLRNSKDEEIIAHLYIYLLTNGAKPSSANTLKAAYQFDNDLKNLLDDTVGSEDGLTRWMECFAKTIGIICNIFETNNFAKTLFGNRKAYNKDCAFIVLFISIANLLLDQQSLVNRDGLVERIRNLGNSDLHEITSTAEISWNIEIRDKLIERVTNIIRQFFSYNTNSSQQIEEWEVRMVNFLQRAEVEEQMYDFKAGITNFETGQFNASAISKIVETLAAMANTQPSEDGYVILGIPDNNADADIIASRLGTSCAICNNRKILGIKAEACKYYHNVDQYLQRIKQAIEQEPVSDAFKNEILSNCYPFYYADKLLYLFQCKSSELLIVK